MESGQWKPRHTSSKKAVRCKSKSRAARRRSESAAHREGRSRFPVPLQRHIFVRKQAESGIGSVVCTDEGTEVTGTTRASGGHDSGEEVEDGNSPSPLPVRDSKAVSPEEDGLKAGRKDASYVKGAGGGAAKVALPYTSNGP